MEGYCKEEIKGNILYTNQKVCPFNDFKKCIGQKCSLYAITGYINDEGKEINYGDCSMVKLPTLLIDLNNTISLGETTRKS